MDTNETRMKMPRIALVAAGMLVGTLLLTVMGADVYRQGVTVVGPNATSTNTSVAVFTGSGVASNTVSADGKTNTVTISGGGNITLTNDTSLAAGTVSGTSPGTVFGMGTLVESGAYQMFTDQVNTNDTYNMTASDIGKLFSYTITTNSPVFTLTNASAFAKGQAVAVNVVAGSTSNLAARVNLSTAVGDTFGLSLSNIYFSAVNDSAIFVSDGVSSWKPIGLSEMVYAAYRDDTDVSYAAGDQSVTFNDLPGPNLVMIDTHGIHSTSVNPTRFTIPYDGVYIFYLWTSWDSTSVTSGKGYRCGIYKNGDVNTLQICYRNNNTGATLAQDLSGTTTFYLQKGEYVEAYVSHNDSGSRTMIASIIFMARLR